MKKGLLIGGLIIAGAGIGALAHKVISKPKEEKVSWFEKILRFFKIS